MGGGKQRSLFTTKQCCLSSILGRAGAEDRVGLNVLLCQEDTAWTGNGGTPKKASWESGRNDTLGGKLS